MVRLKSGVSLIPLLLVAVMAWSARAETPRHVDDAAVTRVYRVADLILPAADYTFEGIQIPGVGTRSFVRVGPAQYHSGYGFGGAIGGGGYGGGGFGGGSGGGSGGGGLFPKTKSPSDGHKTRPVPRTTMRVDWDVLIEGITSTVAPSTWEEVGGIGTIAPVGKLMVVRQTPAVHKQIGDLLATLREEGGAAKTVTVRAFWVVVDSEQLASLRVTEHGQTQINRQVLDAIVADGGSRGEVTCLDGQTVHIVSGRIRSSVTSVIPVVGQRSDNAGVDGLALRRTTPSASDKGVAAELREKESHVPIDALAQVDSAGNNPKRAVSTDGWNPQTRQVGVGYQPVHNTMNLGALLQITPTLIPGNHAVVLDVHSFVTRLGGDGQLSVPFDDVVPLERLDVIAQQFMTTLWMPLGRPVFVAGSTLEPNVRPGTDEQLYLVIEADVTGSDGTEHK